MSTRPDGGKQAFSIGELVMYAALPILIFAAVASGISYFDSHPDVQITISSPE